MFFKLKFSTLRKKDVAQKKPYELKILIQESLSPLLQKMRSHLPKIAQFNKAFLLEAKAQIHFR